MAEEALQKVAETVVKKKRPDKSEQNKVQMAAGENSAYNSHTLRIATLPEIDHRDATAVWNRIAEYFSICQENDMKPSVSGLALAFDVDRKTIWAWANGVDSKTLPAEVRKAIQKAYRMLNAQMEDYMQNGKINPVSGIFLMKNNMGYQDKQEVVLTPNSPLGDQTSPEELQQKYIEAVGTAEDAEE